MAKWFKHKTKLNTLEELCFSLRTCTIEALCNCICIVQPNKVLAYQPFHRRTILISQIFLRGPGAGFQVLNTFAKCRLPRNRQELCSIILGKHHMYTN